MLDFKELVGGNKMSDFKFGIGFTGLGSSLKQLRIHSWYYFSKKRLVAKGNELIQKVSCSTCKDAKVLRKPLLGTLFFA